MYTATRFIHREARTNDWESKWSFVTFVIVDSIQLSLAPRFADRNKSIRSTQLPSLANLLLRYTHDLIIWCDHRIDSMLSRENEAFKDVSPCFQEFGGWNTILEACPDEKSDWPRFVESTQLNHKKTFCWHVFKFFYSYKVRFMIYDFSKVMYGQVLKS